MNSRPLDQFLAHSGWLHGLARSLVLDDAQADDAVQETWLAALNAGEVERPRAWLGGTLRNVLRSRGRSSARRTERERRAARPEATSNDSLEVVERQEALLALVRELPEAQRDCVVARYFDGESVAEIARRTGTPLDTVKSRLKRGLDHLRASLDAKHGDRATWAAWLLPLAPKTARASGLGVFALAALVVATIVGGVLLVRAVQPGAARPGTHVATVQVAPTQPAVAQTPATPRAQPTQRTPVSPGAGVPVQVLKANGEPAGPGVRVWALQPQTLTGELQREISAFSTDMERIAEEYFPFSETGVDGTTRVDLEPPFILWVRAPQESAVQIVQEAASEFTLNMLPTPPLVVRVLDEDRNSVEGIPVGAAITLQDSNLVGVPPDTTRIRRITTADGAQFQDPTGLWSADGSALFDGAWTARWTRVVVHVPGVKVGPSRFSQIVDDVPSDRAGRPFKLDLSLPLMGSLELRLSHEDAGSAAPLNGTVSLALCEPNQRPRGHRFEASLIDGRALWPQVVVGKRFRLRVQLDSMDLPFDFFNAGPTEVGEHCVVSTQFGSGAGFKVLLTDEAGAPLSDRKVLVEIPDRDQRGRYETIRGTTDSAGVLETKWDQPDGLGDRIAVTVSAKKKWLRRGSKVHLLELELTPSMRHSIIDLGPRVAHEQDVKELHGRVVDSKGQPVAGVNVSATQFSGMNFADVTSKSGEFSISGPFPDTVSILLWGSNAGVLDRRLEVPRSALANAQEFVLHRGASLEGSLQLPEFADQTRLQLRLADEAGSSQFGQHEVDGSFRFESLSEGVYRLRVSLGNELVFLSVANLHVPHSGVVLDPRLQNIRIAELLRPLKVEPRNDVKFYCWDPSSDTFGSPQSEPWLVPKLGTFAARFSKRGQRDIYFPDVAQLPEPLVLEFEAPIEVQVRLTGEAPDDTDIYLQGEPGSPCQGAQVPLNLKRGSAPTTVRFGTPGSFRLCWKRRQSSRESDDGIMTASISPPVRTTHLVQIADVIGQEIVIDVGAPALETK